MGYANDKRRRPRAVVGMLTLVLSLLCACSLLVACGPREEQVTAPIEHVYTTAMARGATVAHLLLEADAPLAENVPADAVVLDGALRGYSLDDVKRLDERALDLTVSLPDGAKTIDEPVAYVALDAPAFAGAHENARGEASDDEALRKIKGQGHAQVIPLSVGDPLATIVPLDGSFDEQDRCFYLPISLGAAEFVGEPEAADFTLGDERLSITGVDYDGSMLNEATLRIDATAAGTAREAFDALDEALTARGIVVAASVTNCGEITIGSDDMRAARQGGFETTALSCLAACPVAIVDTTHATEAKKQGDGETACDVHIQAKIDAKPGSCVLPGEGDTQQAVVELLDGETGQMLDEGITRLDNAKLYLGVPLTAKVAEALTGATGTSAFTQAQPLVAGFARAHRLVLEEGVLSNAWGIEEPKTEVPIYITRDLTIDEGAQRLSYAEKHEMMETTGEVPSEADGEAEREGFAYLLTGEDPAGLSARKDMVAWLEAVGGTHHAIDAKLDQLQSQLVDTERRLGCYEDLCALRAALARTQIYGSAPRAEAQAVTAVQSAYGLDATRDTIRLGELIPDALEHFDACVDAAVGWEPERALCHKLFVRQLQYAYLSGYVAATASSQGQPDAALEANREAVMARLG